MITKLANDYLSMSKEDYVNDRLHNFDEKFDKSKKDKRNGVITSSTMLGAGMGALPGLGSASVNNTGIKGLKKAGKGGLLGAGLGAVGGTALGSSLANRYEKSREPRRENATQAIGALHGIYSDMNEKHSKTPEDRAEINRQLGTIQLA